MEEPEIEIKMEEGLTSPDITVKSMTEAYGFTKEIVCPRCKNAKNKLGKNIDCRECASTGIRK